MAEVCITSEQITDSFPHGFMVLDGQDRVVQWNAWLVKKTGISCEQAMGQTLQQLYPEVPKVVTVIDMVRSQSRPYICSQKLHKYFIPITLPEHHISGFHFMQQECHLVPLGDKPFHISISIRDLTPVVVGEQRIGRLQKELESATQNAQAASHTKSLFLANMSHELRTPLNSLLLLSGDLAENDTGNLTDDQLKRIDVIRNGGQDLLNIINDILDLSKVEAGKLEIHEDVLVTDLLVKKLMNQFIPLAGEKALDLRFEVGEKVPAVFATDVQRSLQILRNLLANAIKFTHEGCVTLSIESCEKGTQYKNLSLHNIPVIAFHVIDSGIGISDEILQHIFDAFKQGDGSTSREYGGTGLGLSISKHLAELLGGEIEVCSEIGKGSRFSLLLPLREVSFEKEKVAADSRKYGFRNATHQDTFGFVEKPLRLDSLKNQRAKMAENFNHRIDKILVVDDDMLTLKTLTKILQNNSFTARGAKTIESAIEMLSQERYDAILLDLQLEHRSGLDIIEALRVSDVEQRPPLLVHSSRELSSKEQHQIRDSYQPISNQKADGDALKSKGFTVNEGFGNTLEGKRVLIVDDDERNIFALTSVISKHGMDIATASNGQQACDLVSDDPRFDLILMDVMMPVMDGYEATRKIRKIKGYEETPIIAVTAKAMREDQQRCLNAGATDFLAKPLDLSELHRVLQASFQGKVLA